MLTVERPARFGTGGAFAGLDHTIDINPLLDAAAFGRSGRKVPIAAMHAYTTLPSSLASDLVEGMAAAGLEVLTWPSSHDDSGSLQTRGGPSALQAPARAYRTPDDGPGFAAAPSAAALSADAAFAGMGAVATDGKRHHHGLARVVIAGASPAYARVLSRLAQLGRPSSVLCTPAEWAALRAALPEGAHRHVTHIPVTEAVWDAMLPLASEGDEEAELEATDASEDGDDRLEPEGAGEEDDDRVAAAAVGSVDEDDAGASGAGGTERLARDMARAVCDLVKTRRPLGTSPLHGTYASMDEVSAALLRSGGVLGTLRRGDMTALEVAMRNPTVLRVLGREERAEAARHMMSLSAGARGQMGEGEELVLEVMPRRLWGKEAALAEAKAEAAAEAKAGGAAATGSDQGAGDDGEEEDAGTGEDDEETVAEDDEQEEDDDEQTGDDDEKTDDSEEEEDTEIVEDADETEWETVYVDSDGKEVAFQDGEGWEYEEQAPVPDPQGAGKVQTSSARPAMAKSAESLRAAVLGGVAADINEAILKVVATSQAAGVMPAGEIKPTKEGLREAIAAVGGPAPRKSDAKAALATQLCDAVSKAASCA